MKARAKINLSLDITSRRPDNYHEIKTIMQSIDLHDNMVIEIINKGIELECNYPKVPCDNRNIAYKAAELFMNKYSAKYGIKCGVKIKIDKNIPVAAGLAGGSSNAAAVLIGMNKLFNCRINISELISTGKQLGADIPYCIMGGTVLAEGIGDVLSRLMSIPKTYIVLVVPKIEVSTKWVYENFNFDKVSKRPDINLLLSAISKGDVKILADNMVNVLETVTAEKFDVINDSKQKLKDFGALGSLMSGSGPSVFGIFKDKVSAYMAYQKIKCNDYNLFVTETT
ncbi:MAG: 4-(cytidine 5'-diphospho)-2-C-methyl-D-erythritol kinase [Clostridiaceae bacterium]|nr:4-(cytidine 5'-diphospho)-2-C-methyl-D-erythritol kinase [Clostridiaceae bacterium]